MFFGHCLSAVNSVAHLDRIKIHLHNPLFTPHQLYKPRKIHLEALAYPRTSRPKKHVLSCLLRYGRCTQFAFLRMFTITFGGMFYRLKIKPMVLQEFRILAGHHGLWQIGRNLVERYPVVFHLQAFPVGNLLVAAYKHQRCEVNRQKTQCHYSKNSGGKECHHYPFKYSLKNSHFLSVSPSHLLSFLGVLNHLLRSIHVNLYATILLATSLA